MAGVPYVFGNATTSIPLTNLDANFNTGLTIGNTTVGLGNTVTTLGNVTIANATTISAAGNVFLATSSGSVGIGTTSPAANLDVSSSGATIASISTTGVSPGVGLKLIGATATYKNWLIGSSYAVTAGALEFIPSTTVGGSTFTTPAMTINSSGQVLMNCTSQLLSQRLLSVFSPVTAATFANNNSGQQTIDIWNQATTGNNDFVSFATDAGATERGTITYNRGAGVVAYNVTSDYRAKTIDGDIENALNEINAIKTHKATMNDATISMPMFVAHELAEVAPYCVTGEKDELNEDGTPKYQQVDSSPLIPLLVKAMQEQQALITTLQEQVTALQAKVGV